MFRKGLLKEIFIREGSVCLWVRLSVHENEFSKLKRMTIQHTDPMLSPGFKELAKFQNFVKKSSKWVRTLWRKHLLLIPL